MATGKLQPRGTRVRVELIDPAYDFAVEGVVRWVRQVPPALRTITSAGFGVRFLEVHELMTPLVQKDRQRAAEQLGPEATPAGIRVRGTSERRAPSAPGVDLGVPIADRRARTETGSSAHPRPGTAGAAAAPRVPNGDAPVYKVQLDKPRQFLDRFESELIDGVLFIETDRLLDVKSPVTVLLVLPPPHGALRLSAYVVLRLDAGAPGSDGKMGIAVELLNRRAALNKLKPVVADLEAQEEG